MAASLHLMLQDYITFIMPVFINLKIYWDNSINGEFYACNQSGLHKVTRSVNGDSRRKLHFLRTFNQKTVQYIYCMYICKILSIVDVISTDSLTDFIIK